MALDSEAAQIITKAQNFLSGVKDDYPDTKPIQAAYLNKLNQEQVVAEVMWTLGTKIPRLARGGRLQEAREKLFWAQGLMVGSGLLTYHDVQLITDARPLSKEQKARFDHLHSAEARA